MFLNSRLRVIRELFQQHLVATPPPAARAASAISQAVKILQVRAQCPTFCPSLQSQNRGNEEALKSLAFAGGCVAGGKAVPGALPQQHSRAAAGGLAGGRCLWRAAF